MENDIKVNMVFLYFGILSLKINGRNLEPFYFDVKINLTKFWSLGIAKILVRLAMLLFSVKKFGAFSL